MVLHHQILFSLAIIAIAEAILIRISTEQVWSLLRVAPRFLKLFTSSNFWSFMPICALMLFVLLVVTLLFSVLTSIPYAVALYESVGEVLKFTTAATHKIEVVGKSQAAYGPSTNGNGCEQSKRSAIFGSWRDPREIEE